MTAQTGLCRTWLETEKPVFHKLGLKFEEPSLIGSLVEKISNLILIDGSLFHLYKTELHPDKLKKMFF